MADRAYFDWNATAPLRPAARAAMAAALDTCGNASSVHGEGRAARAVIEDSRAKVAGLLGADPKNVVFTSGGTEANMLALTPTIEIGGDKAPRDRLFVSAVEHTSVRAGGRFAEHEELPVDAQGRVNLAELEQRIAKAERPLVSVMLANNETGVIQPVTHVADIVHRANGLLHVDAIQGAGRIPCRIDELGADLMSVSAHKIGGPQGVGALVHRDGIRIAEPLIKGGGQERNRRAGTENVAAIAGFGAAAAAAQETMAADAKRMATLRDRLEAGLKAKVPEILIFGAEVERLPNTTLFAAPGMKAETAVISFDLNGIAVSSGSACSSGKVQESHVLAAMGVESGLRRGAVRLSLGWTTTDKDVELVLSAWIKLAAPLLKEGRGIAA